jgi:hypothetical protein
MGSECPHREPEGMTDQGPDTTTTIDAATDPDARGSNGLLLDPDAARREERRGWVMLTGIFVGGGLLVGLAAFIT